MTNGVTAWRVALRGESMTDLLLVLLPIALLDSLSMVPLTVAPLALMLNGGKPITTTTAFLAGIFLAYFFGGVFTGRFDYRDGRQG